MAILRPKKNMPLFFLTLPNRTQTLNDIPVPAEEPVTISWDGSRPVDEPGEPLLVPGPPASALQPCGP